MPVLYFDAFSGISGDMTVGALLDLGVDFDDLKAELAKLPLQGYRLSVSRTRVNAIGACKFDVEVAGQGESVPVGSHHGGPEDPDHAHHPHPGTLAERRESGHAHRAFRDIRAMIEASQLSGEVKSRAVAIFTKLAVAEGRVHGVAPDDVTFHEVGAVDSIIDIVGAAVGLTSLGIEDAYVSELPLGSGLVCSQHGMIPVPGPATLELLRDFPVRAGDGRGELITPTGAAILSTLVTPGALLPPLRVARVGYGAGSKRFADRPNVLRLLLGTVAAAAVHDQMVIVETNIDDASPELYEYVMELLFAAGARDVWLTPVQMKKNRPGTTLHALVDPAQRDAVASVILRETPAIGVRYFAVERTVLPREQIVVETELGSVPVKVARAPDGTVNFAPEYEACKRVARERGIPLKVVYQAAIAAARRR